MAPAASSLASGCSLASPIYPGCADPHPQAAVLDSLLESPVTEKGASPFVKVSFLPGHPLASELHAFLFQLVQVLAGPDGAAICQIASLLMLKGVCLVSSLPWSVLCPHALLQAELLGGMNQMPSGWLSPEGLGASLSPPCVAWAGFYPSPWPLLPFLDSATFLIFPS